MANVHVNTVTKTCVKQELMWTEDIALHTDSQNLLLAPAARA